MAQQVITLAKEETSQEILEKVSGIQATQSKIVSDMADTKRECRYITKEDFSTFPTAKSGAPSDSQTLTVSSKFFTKYFERDFVRKSSYVAGVEVDEPHILLGMFLYGGVSDKTHRVLNLHICPDYPKEPELGRETLVFHFDERSNNNNNIGFRLRILPVRPIVPVGFYPYGMQIRQANGDYSGYNSAEEYAKPNDDGYEITGYATPVYYKGDLQTSKYADWCTGPFRSTSNGTKDINTANGLCDIAFRRFIRFDERLAVCATGYQGSNDLTLSGDIFYMKLKDYA